MVVSVLRSNVGSQLLDCFPKSFASQMHLPSFPNANSLSWVGVSLPEWNLRSLSQFLFTGQSEPGPTGWAWSCPAEHSCEGESASSLEVYNPVQRTEVVLPKENSWSLLQVNKAFPQYIHEEITRHKDKNVAISWFWSRWLKCHLTVFKNSSALKNVFSQPNVHWLCAFSHPTSLLPWTNLWSHWDNNYLPVTKKEK